ncbi:caspase family protein [Rhizobium leguminosarum]|uniref:caspase family protein n=1 Tax=Rhizobium leguminosarum TaxID=384 RepID=UPI001F395174|nr:caspase family protein [Rhizobium leguminosarum]UIK20670.1 caspase family protein [Rhizobium leguminosarum]
MSLVVAIAAFDVRTPRDRKLTRLRVLASFTALILSFLMWTGEALCAEPEESVRVMPNLRHEGLLFAVAFSPNGKLLASANDQYINLYDVASGNLIRRWKGHSGQTFSLAFSPANEHELWSSGEDGLISVWNIVTGKRTGETKGNGVKSIVFSPGGDLVLSSGEDGLLLRDARSKAVKRVYSKGSFRSGRFSSDGRSIFAIDRSQQVQRRKIVPGFEDLGELATGQVNEKVSQWDTKSGSLIASFLIDQALSVVLDISPDSSRIVVSAYTSVRLYDSRTGTLIKEIANSPSNSARFLPDSDVVVTTELKLFDGVTGNLIGALGHSDLSQSPYWAPDLFPGSGSIALLFQKLVLPSLRAIFDKNDEALEERHEPLAIAISPGGDIVAAADNKRLRLWDVSTRQPIQSLGVPIIWPEVAFTPHGGVVLFLDSNSSEIFGDRNSEKFADGGVRPDTDMIYVDDFFSSGVIRIEAVKNGLRYDIRELRGYTNYSLSSDGKSIVLADRDGLLHLLDVQSGETKKIFGNRSKHSPLLSYSAEASHVLEVYGDRAVLWSTSTGRRLEDFKLPTEVVGNDDDSAEELSESVRFSHDGSHFLLVNDGKIFLGSVAERKVGLLSDHFLSCEQFSQHDDYISAVISNYIKVWRSNTKEIYGSIPFPEESKGCPIVSNSGEYVMVPSASEPSTTILAARDGSQLVKIFRYGPHAWAMTDRVGRFDTGDLDQLVGINWLMPDDPLRPLSPEIFMRDYYEPNLLGRLLACHEAEANGKNPAACAEAFRSVPSLASLNRIQPDVRIVSVKAGPTPDVALVEVEASGKEDKMQPNGRKSTGVYDVRLFRDGQLVGQWPEPPADGLPANDVPAWRKASQVASGDGKAVRIPPFPVRLAGADRGKKVTFTAYGFNEDRVKSTTATDDSYTVPQDIAVAVKPRAYVVAVGVNEYEKAALRLNFAVADARAIETALQGIKGYDVIPVLLTSDYARKEVDKQIPAVDHATKADIRAVLDLLAGKGETERPRLRQEIGTVIDRLAKATPDDLVVIAFSGHGHTEKGRFYILPSDSGGDLMKVDKLISSEELTAWLRDVDAGEMVMIVDACHSAGSVPAGFKPGPMGDRGLGQLAYDKGMRILVATQADNVALESGSLGQGLLTYALREGLTSGAGAHTLADTDGNGAVTMKEWLTYAETRVPGLYRDVLAGKIEKTRDSSPDPNLLEDTTRHAQTPALFDFVRRRNLIVLSP